MEKIVALLTVDFPEVEVVACEKATALEGRKPAPELQVAIRRLQTVVRKLGREFYTYNPSTVAGLGAAPGDAPGNGDAEGCDPNRR